MLHSKGPLRFRNQSTNRGSRAKPENPLVHPGEFLVAGLLSRAFVSREVTTPAARVVKFVPVVLKQECVGEFQKNVELPLASENLLVTPDTLVKLSWPHVETCI